MSGAASSLDGCLRILDQVSPDAPLLALGQTVLGEEPMKAGVALAAKRKNGGRRLVAGVHDTDYFAKLPGESAHSGEFRAMVHNATTTRGLWSAAGEFSALFGSETVIGRQDFLSAGLNLVKVNRERPGIFDEASAAFGWLGIVSLRDDPAVVSELPLASVLPALRETLDWAISETLDCIAGPERHRAIAKASELRAIFETHARSNEGRSLSALYRDLLPDLYSFCANEKVVVEPTASSELLRFNCDTYSKPRFELVERFLHPETRDEASAAYDEAIHGSEIYSLDRFGSGAIPFDLVIPGKGRGTIRVGNRALAIMTPAPQFVTLKQPLRTLRDLATAIERKFGRECVLIGKAVTLIGMLGREFVFVFHEGASSYVRYTRRLHDALEERGIGLELNPVLRVKYSPWDALDGCCSWFRLPEPLAQAFGSEEVCSPSFANRWRDVCGEQQALIEQLGHLRRPMGLIQFLDEYAGGSWRSLAGEYQALHDQLEGVMGQVSLLKGGRFQIYGELRELRRKRQALEVEKGRHFRESIFEREPVENELRRRGEFGAAIESLIHESSHLSELIHASLREQRQLVGDPKVARVHERRREIELEAELKRMRLIRNAVIASKGLLKAGVRPSAWWFPLVCPSGHWYKKTVAEAECYLEPMSPGTHSDLERIKANIQTA